MFQVYTLTLSHPLPLRHQLASGGWDFTAAVATTEDGTPHYDLRWPSPLQKQADSPIFFFQWLYQHTKLHKFKQSKIIIANIYWVLAMYQTPCPALYIHYHIWCPQYFLMIALLRYNLQITKFTLLKCRNRWFSVYSQSWITVTTTISEHFHHRRKESLRSFVDIPHSLLPLAPDNR